MKIRRPCRCAHAGQCPVNDHVDPLHETYPDGTKVNRPLTPFEQAHAELLRGGTQVNYMPLGGVVATDERGNAFLVAMPIDVERAIAYAKEATRVECRADKFLWRMRHPVPEGDHELSKDQADALRKAAEAQPGGVV